LITTLNGEIFGLPIPDAGPIFAAALVLHILSGLTAVIAGALAATARKQPGRHPRAGRVYLCALGGIFATATIMAAIRWHEDAHLFAIAVIAFSLGLYGYRARRRHRPGWPPHHAIGMGGSYIALLTGFYVDNGPFLPLWDRLPHITYWVLPSLVGVPLIWFASPLIMTRCSSNPDSFASRQSNLPHVGSWPRRFRTTTRTEAMRSCFP
jgi:uncharacterized membrane protein